jgi:hypothetical protein
MQSANTTKTAEQKSTIVKGKRKRAPQDYPCNPLFGQ